MVIWTFESLIVFSEKLNEIWGSGDYETKLSVQKLIFPKGIVINPVEREYRNSDLNLIFGLIHSFTWDYGGTNKKRTGRNTDPFCVVDISIEISNISLTPRHLIDTHHIMTLIIKS